MVKKNKIDVTILVPVYNVENYIERCARSLFEQTYKDIEYTFVDDCSPDRSIEILEKVIENYPQRKPYVRIIRHEHNRGLAAARNTAVDNCQTEFLMHVDSDDYIELDAVESCLNKQNEGDYDIVTFNMVKHFKHYDEQRNQMEITSPKDFTLKLLDGRCAHGVCGNLIRKSLYVDNDIHAIEGVNMAEDYLVMPRLAYCSNRVANLDKTLYHYCFENENSYAFTFSRDKSKQQLKVLDEQLLYFNHEEDYVSALYTEYRRTVLEILKKSIVAGDNDYYIYALKKYKSLPPEIINKTAMGDRIVLVLGYNIVGKGYVKFGYYIKDKYRMIRNRIK